MNKNLTLNKLQVIVKENDYFPDLKDAYFYKLVEEVGELGNVLRKHNFMNKPSLFKETKNIKGSIEEELYDVLHYVVAIANLYDIKLEDCCRLKIEYNKNRYNKNFID